MFMRRDNVGSLSLVVGFTFMCSNLTFQITLCYLAWNFSGLLHGFDSFF